MIGLRLSLNTALLLTVSADLISAPDGFGSLVERAWRSYLITDLYVALVVIGLLGAVIRLVVELVASAAAPWSQTT